MKQLCIFVLSIILINTFLCSGTSTTEHLNSNSKKSTLSVNNEQPSLALGPNLPLSNSYYEGWVHYYHYNNATTIGRPRKFFQNNEYLKLIKIQTTL